MKMSYGNALKALSGVALLLFLVLQPTHASGCQVLSKSALESKAQRYSKTIRSASSKYGVNENLIKAVITVESCFRSRARGSLGEKGLMQLMPATARRFNVKRGYHPWDNIHGGTRYLGHLMKQYNGNLTHTVAAYNAGEGNIRPGKKIRNMTYVRKVLRAYNKFGGRKTSKPGSRVQREPSRRQQNASKSGIRRQPQASRNRTQRPPAPLFRVRPGDTVYEVMRQTGVPVNRIIRLNRLQAPYHLLRGQTLRLR